MTNTKMTLREKQSAFARALGQLLTHIYAHNGVEITMGEGHVDSRTGHMRDSLHYCRLAQDINLFVGGKYIRGSHLIWDLLGDYWKSLNSLARWGGDFKSRDYNHFSFEHEGKQ